MATLNPIADQTVPFGSTAEVDITFTTAGPHTVTLTVTENGASVGTGTITFDAEVAPTVNASATGAGWEIQASGGTLTALGSNKFTVA